MFKTLKCPIGKGIGSYFVAIPTEEEHQLFPQGVGNAPGLQR